MATEDWLKQIADTREPYTSRIDAIEAVRSDRDPKVLDALLKALTDPDIHVRRKVAEVLAEFKDQARSFDALRSALNDDDEGVRRNALKSLGEFADDRVYDLARKAEKDPSTLVQRAAQDVMKSRPRPATAAPAPALPVERPAPAPRPPFSVSPRPSAPPAPAPPPPPESHAVPVPEPPPQRPVRAPEPAPAPHRDALDLLRGAWGAANSGQVVGAAASCTALAILGAIGIGSLFGENTPTENPQVNQILCWCSLCAFIWIVFSLFGLAMTRMIALRMAGGGVPGTDEAFGFAVRRWLRALLVPIPCLLVLAIAAGGEVFLKSTVAPQEGSLLGAGIFLASFGLGLVAVGAALFLIVGGQLWLPCLAVEDAGIGHAIGTAFLFAVRRPWTCLLYEAAVLLRSAVIIAVVGVALFFAGPRATSHLGLAELLALIRQPFASLSWGGIIIGVAQGIVLVIAGGYVFAALLATPVAAYLSIRSAVSGASRTEVQR